MRTLSLTGLQASLREQVNEVFLKIIEVTHPDLGTPLRLVANQEDLVRTEGTYTAFGFDVELPDDEEEQISTVNLIVPIVDQTMVQTLRNATNTPFGVELRVVRASEPNVTEAGPFNFESVGIRFTETRATISLTPERHLQEDAYPKGIFSPSNIG